jgi:tetratricopeptide (TPR) repeat protein
LFVGWGLYYWHFGKEAILNATQEAIKEEAIRTASQSAKAVKLDIGTKGLKDQARIAMRENNPLMAYLFAQEAISRDPSDTAAPKLLEQAQQAMAALPPGRTDGDISRMLSTGDIDAAEAVLEASLRRNPNNMRVRENMARVSLLQARIHINQDGWDRARSYLLMGAALYPRDPSWQARLYLLEKLRSLPKEEKEEQQRWLDLLG